MRTNSITITSTSTSTNPERLPAVATWAGRAALALVLLLALPRPDLRAANPALLGRARDGSRADAVHRITLYDGAGQKIVADDLHPQPFSTRMSCGECHDYGKIGQGWHFSNDLTTATQPTRPGEPWILSDPLTGTQLPLALHRWTGAWAPARVGLTPWQFAKRFGSHLPGGGIADVDETSSSSLDAAARWEQSGPLEVNCLACHGGSPRQDQSEWAAQVGRGNFQWAATAASGLASVEGAVSSLPLTYAPADGASLDDGEAAPPSVKYDPAAFDPKNKVFMDIKGRPEDGRCLFCHSTARVGEAAHQAGRDVHLTAGLQCVDCHRNGPDHQILRGGEEEPGVRNDPDRMSLTCRGCHLGEGGAGRLRAPRPAHKGLPPLHLEKLSCTACHSGAEPQGHAQPVRTARAHKLGLRASGEPEGPATLSPVFVRQGGQVRPCNVVWPAFWGRNNKDGEVTPLLPEKVTKIAGGILQARDDSATTGTEKVLSEAKVARALGALAKAEPGAGEPVYVAGGRLYRLDGQGKLAWSENAAAEPYAWPIAHDVRPASQALGAKGCTECHAPDSPFFFGSVAVTDPLAGDKAPREVRMWALEGQDARYASLLGRSFAFRPYFKLFGFAAAGLVLGVLTVYGLSGLGGLCRRFGRRD